MFIEVYKKYYEYTAGLKGQIIVTKFISAGKLVNSELIKIIEIDQIVLLDRICHKIFLNDSKEDLFITEEDYQKLACLKQEK